jgi:large subunit ribosomal protein L22
MQTRAIARGVGHPPRKVRRVTEVIRGRRVDEALAILKFLPNAPARDVFQVLSSAIANAENNFEIDPDTLWVANASVDEGITIKRFRARSHGRASRIMRRSSHITVIVTDDPTDMPKTVRQGGRR